MFPERNGGKIVIVHNIKYVSYFISKKSWALETTNQQHKKSLPQRAVRSNKSNTIYDENRLTLLHFYLPCHLYVLHSNEYSFM